MKNVEGVVTTRGRQAVVIKDYGRVVKLIGNNDQAASFGAYLQRAYTSLSATACGLERSNLGKLV